LRLSGMDDEQIQEAAESVFQSVGFSSYLYGMGYSVEKFLQETDAAVGADAVGFVFAPSSRQATLEEAARICARLPPHVEEPFLAPARTGVVMIKKRKKKLIEPRLQLRFSLAFLSTALLLVLVQAIVIHFVLQRIAARLPHDSEILRAEIPGALLISFACTFLLLAPLSLAIGVNTTMLVAVDSIWSLAWMARLFTS